MWALFLYLLEGLVPESVRIAYLYPLIPRRRLLRLEVGAVLVVVDYSHHTTLVDVGLVEESAR